MTVLILTLTALVALATVGFGLRQLVGFIRSDGYRRRSAPRSHYADPFDPGSRFA